MPEANVRYTANGISTMLHVPDPWAALFAFQQRHFPKLAAKPDAVFERIQRALADDRARRGAK